MTTQIRMPSGAIVTATAVKHLTIIIQGAGLDHLDVQAYRLEDGRVVAGISPTGDPQAIPNVDPDHSAEAYGYVATDDRSDGGD